MHTCHVGKNRGNIRTWSIANAEVLYKLVPLSTKIAFVGIARITNPAPSSTILTLSLCLSLTVRHLRPHLISSRKTGRLLAVHTMATLGVHEKRHKVTVVGSGNW